MIKVLIVDDSKTTREYLKYVIEADPALCLVAEAENGSDAVVKVKKYRPDVVIMDIQMPEMDGYDATRQIMETTPVPIVVHSTLVAPENSRNIFAAMQAGAVAVAEKPPGIGHPESEALTRKLLRTVKLMSEVKVVKRKQKVAPREFSSEPVLKTTLHKPAIIGIGASTGGPPMLQSLLSRLPETYPVPILVVQHITKGFLPGLVHWLSQTTPLSLRIPRSGEAVKPGSVYFAPEDMNMGITSSGNIFLSPFDPALRGFRPISHMFQSLANAYGRKSCGILLTGMGNDGSAGMKEMKKAEARTIAQDRESSVIFGMPAEAIKLNAVDYVLSSTGIAEYLVMLGSAAAD